MTKYGTPRTISTSELERIIAAEREDAIKDMRAMRDTLSNVAFERGEEVERLQRQLARAERAIRGKYFVMKWDDEKKALVPLDKSTRTSSQ